jgi:hypothetical protein
MKSISKPLIWINFHKLHIGFNTMLENSHIYKEFLALNKNYTPIEQKVIEIQINNNPSHIITRIQFHIQIIVGCTIHHAQGLTLELLAFNPVDVTKHGLTYTTLFQIPLYNLYLLSPLLTKNFQVDFIIEQKMYRLQITI